MDSFLADYQTRKDYDVLEEKITELFSLVSHQTTLLERLNTERSRLPKLLFIYGDIEQGALDTFSQHIQYHFPNEPMAVVHLPPGYDMTTINQNDSIVYMTVEEFREILQREGMESSQ